MEEWRTWGPPGTGKTTWIAEEATRLAEEYGADQVSICSLTNAAVREAADRNIPIGLDNLTTLHARCKRALQAPPPAEAYMSDFIKAHPLYANHVPHRRDDSTQSEIILSSGFTIYDEVQIARQRMMPIGSWRYDMREWYSVWSRWCAETGLMDYTSWLEVAKERRCLPAQAIVFVDEAQDHTPLQLATIRSWKSRRLVLVGDDDQSLYEWSGSVPEEFLRSDVPKEREMTLEQSYRVPRSVHQTAMEILSRISNRKVKIYSPTDTNGSVKFSNFNLDDSRVALMPDIDDGQVHMILTSCSYMLNGIIHNLKEASIPFHNPYRMSNLSWNPLATETALASRKYLIGEWTGSAIMKWMAIMRDDIFRNRDGLSSLCAENQKNSILPSDILPYLSESTAEILLSRRPEALLKLKRRSIRGEWDYYIKTLGKDPKVIVGTIHSVKGGEADCVHIFPDLSAAGYAGALRILGLDSLHRLFYVAVTRAKHSVIIQDLSSPNSYFV